MGHTSFFNVVDILCIIYMEYRGMAHGILNNYLFYFMTMNMSKKWMSNWAG